MIFRWAFVLKLLSFALLLGLAVACAPQKEPDLAVLQDKVRNILQLHTYELVYRDITWVSESSKALGIFTTVDKRTLFSVNIRVRAGLDFARGLSLQFLRNSEDRSIDGVLVALPPPAILLVDVDEKSFHEYFSFEFGQKIKRGDWGQELAKARDRVRSDAVSRGILVKADENAKRILRNFLSIAGFARVEFTSLSMPLEQATPAASVKPGDQL